MLVNFRPDRLTEFFDRACYVIDRGVTLLGGVLDFTAGSALAFIDGAVSLLPDAQLTRLAKPSCTDCTPLSAHDTRVLLLILVVGGTVWAVHGGRKIGAWFTRSTEVQL